MNASVKWHGDTPASWQVVRFKTIANIHGGQVDPRLDCFKRLPLFAPDHIESGTGRLLAVSSAEEQGASSGKYSVSRGDILYSKIRPALRKVAFAPSDGLCSADVYPIQAKPPIRSRYLFWVMLSEGFARYTLLESDRVAMPKINRASLGECPVPVAPELTQAAIAIYLDRKTAAIDALIEKKERLIKLLKEKRQALITQAVTKGLDPDVPMKDSGVEWIGEIPAHWCVFELKRLARTGTSITYGIVQPGPQVDGGISYIRTSDMAGEDLRHERFARTSAEIASKYPRSRLRQGDIVIAIRATVGKTHVAPATLEGANLTQGTAKITPGEGIDSEFLHLALQSTQFLRQVEAASKGATFLEITLDSLRRMKVAVPPLGEQRDIKKTTAGRIERIRAATLALERQIRLASEYRQALITAAVTGQIDIPAEEPTTP